MNRNNSTSTSDVLVLGSDGTNLGHMPYRSAKQLADDQNLDLVQINKSDEKLNVFKIMDQGKWKYLKRKAHKKSHSHTLKEMNFRVSIDVRDKEVKINHIKRFLSKGMDVKISIQMRGREKANSSVAKRKMDDILLELDELILVKQRKSSSSLITAIVRPKQGNSNASEEVSEKDDKDNAVCRTAAI